MAQLTLRRLQQLGVGGCERTIERLAVGLRGLSPRRRCPAHDAAASPLSASCGLACDTRWPIECAAEPDKGSSIEPQALRLDWPGVRDWRNGAGALVQAASAAG